MGNDRCGGILDISAYGLMGNYRVMVKDIPEEPPDRRDHGVMLGPQGTLRGPGNCQYGEHERHQLSAVPSPHIS
jgi:hypothetical protein